MTTPFPVLKSEATSKNIEGSAHDAAATIAYLRAQGAQRIVLASGECTDDLRADQQFADVDGICANKIPESLEPFFGGATISA